MLNLGAWRLFLRKKCCYSFFVKIILRISSFDNMLIKDPPVCHFFFFFCVRGYSQCFGSGSVLDPYSGSGSRVLKDVGMEWKSDHRSSTEIIHCTFVRKGGYRWITTVSFSVADPVSFFRLRDLNILALRRLAQNGSSFASKVWLRIV